jgi:hypothetical protein
MNKETRARHLAAIFNQPPSAAKSEVLRLYKENEDLVHALKTCRMIFKALNQTEAVDRLNYIISKAEE